MNKYMERVSALFNKNLLSFEVNFYECQMLFKVLFNITVKCLENANEKCKFM